MQVAESLQKTETLSASVVAMDLFFEQRVAYHKAAALIPVIILKITRQSVLT